MTPRYELKYWASEAAARELLVELGSLLERDVHSTDADPSYTVTSLYYDTQDLDYFFKKIEGERKRVKVRLRRVAGAEGGWAELKAKTGRRIRKWRVRLTPEDLARVARGDTEPLLVAGHDDVAAASKLLREHSLHRLRPLVITRFDREAYLLCDDPGVRIALDRNLAFAGDDLIETFLAEDVADLPMRSPPTPEPVILEVKAWGPVPSMIASAVRRQGLSQRAISKYCLGVSFVGADAPSSRPHATQPRGMPRG